MTINIESYSLPLYKSHREMALALQYKLKTEKATPAAELTANTPSHLVSQFHFSIFSLLSPLACDP